MHREMNFQVKESCTLFSFLFQVSKEGEFFITRRRRIFSTNKKILRQRLKLLERFEAILSSIFHLPNPSKGEENLVTL